MSSDTASMDETKDPSNSSPKKRKPNNQNYRRRGPPNGGGNSKRKKDDNYSDGKNKGKNANTKRNNNFQGKRKNQKSKTMNNAVHIKKEHGVTDGNTKEQATTESNTKKVHMTNNRFAELTEVSAASRRALAETFKYEFMTEVQAQTLPVILDSNRRVDVLAKAKTGTGKTLGFLIPTVEKLLLASKAKRNNEIGCLIISPTRELAYQISKEGEKLLTFHNPKMKVLACVGGTPVKRDLSALRGNVHIIVATPGRLLDHLQNTELKLTSRMSSLEVLVLDEADQLLDMGFRPDIERVLNLLKPSQSTRQTLLFSATVPKTVSEIARIALKPQYEYIDTVGEDEEQTHAHVRQEVMQAPSPQIRAIASILDREIKASTPSKPCKIIVFYTTARLTGFMAELFNSIINLTKFPKILEIHSRKSQAYRQRASERFRTSKENTILFSSDVSARGMDYPGITFVLQVGLTERAQYIHRLGRTARAGNEGKGTLLLSPFEHRFMTQKVLSDMPLEPESVPIPSSSLDKAIDRALQNVNSDKSLGESGEQAYRAWLGYYNGHLKKVGWDKKRLVQEANQWAKDVGLKQQPSLLKKTIGKMGLKGVPGLRIE